MRKNPNLLMSNIGSGGGLEPPSHVCAAQPLRIPLLWNYVDAGCYYVLQIPPWIFLRSSCVLHTRVTTRCVARLYLYCCVAPPLAAAIHFRGSMAAYNRDTVLTGLSYVVRPFLWVTASHRCYPRTFLHAYYCVVQYVKELLSISAVWRHSGVCGVGGIEPPVNPFVSIGTYLRRPS